MARILVIGPAWVGDMVMAQSLFGLLRRRDPAAVIDVVGPSWSLPLVSRMPEVHEGIALDIPHGELALGARWRLARQLRERDYSRAIVLPRSFKSALVPFLASIPRRTGFASEGRTLILNDPRKLDRTRLDQTVKRFLALAVGPTEGVPEAPEPQFRIDLANREALLARYGLGALPAVALMPGAAYGPAKQWPDAYFGELARRLVARGFEVWVLGSADERALGDRVIANAAHVPAHATAGPSADAPAASGGAGGGAASAAIHNLCGRTSLVDTVDLLSAVRAAVTNDSGLMHVAAASGAHVIALYGSSTPSFTPPLTSRRTIHYLALDCSPCFARECPLGHLNCLKGIAPATVEASINAVPGAVEHA